MTQTQMSDRPDDRVAAEEFPQHAEQYRRALMAHCYRMTGSIYEAEDLVQETYIRAWRSYERFEGRSSVRTWLYRIATNVCLTSLEGKERRPMPTGLGTSDSAASDVMIENNEIPWLEPVPDTAVLAAERDSVRLAFVAALQHLPPRQRAVLILRDVLRWKASEVAEALDTSTAAVNSALQRAHAQLAAQHLTEDTVDSDLSPEQQEMLGRYVDAFWRKDIDAIVGMLKHDAIWEMPPFVGWYRGRASIAELIDTQCPGGENEMRMIPTASNGQPAFALYLRGEDGIFRPFQLQVLELDGDQVGHVRVFFGPRLYDTFGLPEELPADSVQPSPSGAP